MKTKTALIIKSDNFDKDELLLTVNENTLSNGAIVYTADKSGTQKFGVYKGDEPQSFRITGNVSGKPTEGLVSNITSTADGDIKATVSLPGIEPFEGTFLKENILREEYGNSLIDSTNGFFEKKEIACWMSEYDKNNSNILTFNDFIEENSEIALNEILDTLNRESKIQELLNKQNELELQEANGTQHSLINDGPDIF